MENYNANALFKKVNMNNTSFEDNRFTIYPSAFANYAPNDKDSYSFSVSKRVDWPSISQINPIREWSTPQIDSEGNPNVEPQYTHSFEVNYTRKTKTGPITSGLFYRQINNEITRIVFENLTSPEKIILSYDNLDDNKAIGVEVSGNFEFTKWYSSSISIDAYNKTVKGYSESVYLEVNNTAFNARIANTFKATKNLRFQLSGIYRRADISIQAMANVENRCGFKFDRNEPKPAKGQFNWESQTAFICFNYRFGTE